VNDPTKEEFDEWRDSRVAKWFFDRIDRQVTEQLVNAAFAPVENRSIEEIAYRVVERRGWAMGVSSVRELRYEEL
jgi:hypothetical protein